MKINQQVITDVVEEINRGNEGAWVNLFAELSEHKERVVYAYSRRLQSFLSKEDVIALYEDKLISTVNYYSENGTGNFFPLFVHNLSIAKKLVTRNNFRDVRVANWKEVVCGDAVKGDMPSGESYFDSLADDHGGCAVENFEAEDYLGSLLREFSNGDKKKEEKAALLKVCMENADKNTAENKEALLAVLPEGTTWATARKKLQRAREEFKEYFENNK